MGKPKPKMSHPSGVTRRHYNRLRAAGIVTDSTVEDFGTLKRAELKLRIAEREKNVELRQIRIEEARRVLIPVEMLRSLLTELRTLTKHQLAFFLLNRGPQQNDGLGAAQQRKNNQAILDEICDTMSRAEADFYRRFFASTDERPIRSRGADRRQRG